jgi:ribosomal protein L7/L12
MGEIVGGIVLLAVAAQYMTLHSELAKLRKRMAALSRVEAKLDLVLEHAGLKYLPYANLPEPVIEALRNANKIQAIKHYRDATGVGLKEAKDFIEEVMATSTAKDTIQVATRTEGGSRR